MPLTLFDNGTHTCLAFTDLVQDECAVDECAVQSNQFLIVDTRSGALIDPGGNMTYNNLFMAMHGYFPPRRLACVLASHADPDIVASANKWMVHTECKIYISKLWARFVPHFCSAGNTAGRIVAIPDEGMRIPLGQSEIIALPAHFLHAEGNFHFYDPVAKILFSGDVGASMVDAPRAGEPVADFDAHLPYMQPFHQRIMVSNRAARGWVAMVRSLDLEWLVPQHGPPFRGKAMIRRFLDWFEKLPCGIDLMGPEIYRVPA